MPFTPEEIADIANTTLDTYIDRKKVHKQNIQNKPMLEAFNAASGEFTGGKGNVSFAVSSGQGGYALQGYEHDDQVNYSNSANSKRVNYPWKEHHQGMKLTITELKIDGIDVDESGSVQTTSEMSEREMQALVDRLDEKTEAFDEDYDASLDMLIHGDGTSDTKALAGIRSLVLDVPTVGVTGGLSRVANPWWRNRAATAAFGGAGGQNAIASAPTNGGVLAQFLLKDVRQLKRYAGKGSKWTWFAGSDWLDAYHLELRANGNYSLNGWREGGKVDLAMANPTYAGSEIQYDPLLDDLGLQKRCYVLDISKNGLQLLYMRGNKLKRHKPARPYDRYVMYNGVTMTGVMVARRLRTSAVYDIQ